MKKPVVFLVFSLILFSTVYGEYTFFEDFTTATFPPPGWTSVNVQGYQLWQRYTSISYSSPASARISYQPVTIGEDWLITPQIEIEVGDTLSFRARKHYSAPYLPDNLYIKISTTTNDTASFTDQIANIEVNSLGTPNWSHLKYDLSTYAGQSIYIGFHHYDENGNGCYIDDVGVFTYNPIITSITDVPGDQGRQIQTIWKKAEMDNSYSPNLFYSLWRLDDVFTRNSPSLVITSLAQFQDALTNITNETIQWQMDDEIWTFIDQIPALQYSEYSYISPTIKDSCSTDINHSTFRVVFHGSTNYYESKPASGYSIDNIPPNAVDNIDIVKSDDNMNIQWAEVTEGTYQGNSYPEINGIWYKIYGSEEPDFVCDPATYIANTEDLNYIYNLSGEQKKFFKVVAVDQQP